MKKLFLLFVFFTTLLNETLLAKDVLIGYYGRPNTKSLGILGQHNIDNLVKLMRKKEAYFQKELGEDYNIQMAFHIIWGLATPDEGRRGDHMLRLNHKSLIRYINRAKEEGFKVIIDLQMGTNSPKEALSLVLDYLKHEHVHLALDPEFKIPKHKRYPPGRFIGHIFANQLNEAQELMNNYIIENNLNKRELIVHMFTKRMLRGKDEVKTYENVDLIYNIDGHGDPAVKIKIYNRLYKKEYLHMTKSGFKIFNVNDTHKMTPRQILGLEKARGRQLWTEPYYINYQ